MKTLSLAILGIGVFMLLQVFLPTVSFKLWELRHSYTLVDPKTDNQVLGVSVENFNSFPAFVSDAKVEDLPYKMFYLNVPKIKLEKIPVGVASNDFEHSLAQLPGTVLPGEIGNVFISGHSSLPQIYSVDNFQTIFTHLTDLAVGDSISTEVLGQSFEYQVEKIFVVDPKDTWVVNPPDTTGRYLTLMTCVPPGFNSRRLIVLAKLKE